MINVLWLLLIIPSSAILGYVMAVYNMISYYKEFPNDSDKK